LETSSVGASVRKYFLKASERFLSPHTHRACPELALKATPLKAVKGPKLSAMKKAAKKLRERDAASALGPAEAAAPAPAEEPSTPLKPRGFTFPELLSLPEAGAGDLSPDEMAALMASEELEAEERRATKMNVNAFELSEWTGSDARPLIEAKQTVRVVEEHPLWMGRLGDRGTCTRLESEMEARVKFDRLMDLAESTVPLSILALEHSPWSKLEKVKTDKMSVEKKMQLLAAVGVEDCFHAGPEEVNEAQLSPEHIDLWVEHSEMSKPVTARVRGLPVILTALVVAGERGEGWAHWGGGGGEGEA